MGIKALHFSVYSAVSVAYVLPPDRTSQDENPIVEDLMKPPNGFPSTSVASIRRFEAENVSYVYKRFDGFPSVFYRHLESAKGCTATIFKTCNEVEEPYVDFIKTQFRKPVLLAGPLVPEPPSGVIEERWANRLANFTSKSVIFCSFGSETFLTDNQIEELALGLELTGLPFFLVLNFPSEVEKDAKLAEVLPQGFLERVKERGAVHIGWVQQPLILAHDSVGCYLCHSGFSSIVEAFMNDCQLVLLPIKGDQFFHSKLIARDLKAGMEVNRRDEDGYFRGEDIKEAVIKVMVEVHKEPCTSIRANQRKWRDFLLNGGIQTKFIEELVAQMKAIA